MWHWQWHNTYANYAMLTSCLCLRLCCVSACDACDFFSHCRLLKGIVHPKMKNLLLLTHHVVLDLYGFLMAVFHAFLPQYDCSEQGLKLIR